MTSFSMEVQTPLDSSLLMLGRELLIILDNLRTAVLVHILSSIVENPHELDW